MSRSDQTPDPNAVLSTVELARLLPGGAKDRRCGVAGNGACHASRMTINRWCAKGVMVSGQRLKLRAVRQGGRWLIRWADWVEFRDACTALAGGDPVRIETPTERKRRARKASEETDKIFAEANRAAKASRAAG